MVALTRTCSSFAHRAVARRVGSTARSFATRPTGPPKGVPKRAAPSAAKPSSAAAAASSPAAASSTAGATHSSGEAASLLQRMHASLPRPPPASSGEKFTTLSGGGWRSAETWTPERRRALRIMTWSWPALMLTGMILYKRWFGTDAEKAQWLEYERMMARSAGLMPKEKEAPPPTTTPTQPQTTPSTSPPVQQPR